FQRSAFSDRLGRGDRPHVLTIFSSFRVILYMRAIQASRKPVADRGDEAVQSGRDISRAYRVRRSAPGEGRSLLRWPPGWRGGPFLVPVLLAAGALILAAPRAPSATSSTGWSAWTAAAAGPTSLAPALAFDAAGGTLELAFVGTDLAVSHDRFAGGKWGTPAKTGQTSAMPPVLLVDAAGTPRLLATGSDGSVTDSSFRNGAWSAPVPTGRRALCRRWPPSMRPRTRWS